MFNSVQSVGFIQFGPKLDTFMNIFHPLAVVDHGRQIQLQVGEYLIK